MCKWISLAQDREMVLTSPCANGFWTNVVDADDHMLARRTTAASRCGDCGTAGGSGREGTMGDTMGDTMAWRVRRSEQTTPATSETHDGPATSEHTAEQAEQDEQDEQDEQGKPAESIPLPARMPPGATNRRVDLAGAAWLHAKFQRTGSAKTRTAYTAILGEFPPALAMNGLDLDGADA